MFHFNSPKERDLRLYESMSGGVVDSFGRIDDAEKNASAVQSEPNACLIFDISTLLRLGYPTISRIPSYDWPFIPSPPISSTAFKRAEP